MLTLHAAKHTCFLTVHGLICRFQPQIDNPDLITALSRYPLKFSHFTGDARTHQL